MVRFRVFEELRATYNGVNGCFVILQDKHSGACAEIWPALGFNCIRWCTMDAGHPIEWLYSSSELLSDVRPTRSGIPILFPFPNRIRAGRYRWNGTAYQLPLNDPTEANAIHGFACRSPWRIIAQGANGDRAWVQGEFTPGRDAPAVLDLWPGNYRIQVTYTLLTEALIITAAVDNFSNTPLPFGLGFHPYFSVAADAEDCTVQVPASKQWRSNECLPNGERIDVRERTDLRTPRSLAALELDDVLTDIEASPCSRVPDLLWRGSLRRLQSNCQLDLCTSATFRELVAFTPPHRQAVCLEPYTCTTDAINLQRSGVDAGLLTLEPGGHWSATVALFSRNLQTQ